MSSQKPEPIGKIIKDLGFNEDRPLSTKQAFINHLRKAAEELRQQQPAPPKVEGEQLVFDPAVLGIKTRGSRP